MTLSACELARALISCRSVTPEDAGALDVVEQALGSLGFTCHRMAFQSAGPRIQNLYARRGKGAPNLCFAGHTDVVPPGQGWSSPPFEAALSGGILIGRGAVDMKGAIAAYIAAVSRLKPSDHGSLSFLITGDEEGPAIDGTQRVLERLVSEGECLDACLVGEPTSRERLGDTVKVGRRGSLNGTLRATGRQGHVAYPNEADNPIPRLLEGLRCLEAPLDEGTERFQPSNLELTTIDVGNQATNVIPASANARFNVRFSPKFSGISLEAELRRRLEGIELDLDCVVSGEPFLTQSTELIDAVRRAINAQTGIEAELSTGGGTSDARFIARHCSVVEFGLVSKTMHSVDESVTLDDLQILSSIYEEFIQGFFHQTKRQGG